MSFEYSRLIVLGQLTRSVGQLYLPEAAAFLSGRYGFTEYPKDPAEQLKKEVIEFRHGKFNDVAVDISLYNDGIIVGSKSQTDLLDSFFQDVTDWARDTLGVILTKTQKVSIMYESTLVVSSQRDVLELAMGQPMRSIGSMISSRLAAVSNLNVEFSAYGMLLAPDLLHIPGMKPNPFRLERRAGTDFSLNRYYSAAPLRTKDHLEVLNEIERLA